MHTTMSTPTSKTDPFEAAFWAGIFMLILLTIGDPDLWDVIMYQLSDGQIPIPVQEVKP